MNIKIAGQEIQIRIGEPELENLLMGNTLEAVTTAGDGRALVSQLCPVLRLPVGMSAKVSEKELNVQVSLERLVDLMRMRPFKDGLVQDLDSERGEPAQVRLTVDSPPR